MIHSDDNNCFVIQHTLKMAVSNFIDVQPGCHEACSRRGKYDVNFLSIFCDTVAQLECQTKQFQKHPVLTL